jgi:lipoprotein-anchoring transpeptidase ErfK/SrfK
VKDARARRCRTGSSALALAAAVGALLLAGCSSSSPSSPSSSGGAAGSATAQATHAPSLPKVTVTPGNGATGVSVTSAVVVHSQVPLVSVAVSRGASTVVGTLAGTLDGQFSTDRMTWTSTGGLFAGSTYQVVATSSRVTGFAGATTMTGSFTTAVPASQFKVSWEPVDGQAVGIGEPVTLTFNAPVVDRAAVQRRLAVTSTPAVTGSWSWQGSTTVRYRPKNYWPSGTKVHVEANLAGYDNGGGDLGVKDRSMTFSIGASQVSYVDAATHTMKVYRDGALVKQFPVSLGREQYPTMDGPHNVIAVAPKVVMDSATVGIPKGNPDYYYETVLWDVQITSGGEYVHAAPWSVGSQGRSNVSHGCVNASDADAEWFYHYSNVGDIVQVSNTGRPADTSQLGNEWSVPWSTWTAGSALPVSSTSSSGGGNAAAGRTSVGG